MNKSELQNIRMGIFFGNSSGICNLFYSAYPQFAVFRFETKKSQLTRSVAFNSL